MGHSVARVQKVQKVQRVQRVVVAADAADYKKRGRGWRSRIEGISAAGRSFSRLFTKPYDTESQSRNADFILIAQEGDTTTLGAKGPVKLKNPPAVRPVHLKNPHTEGVSNEPSHRRRPYTYICIHPLFRVGLE